MIKAESQVIDNDSCEITMEVEGRLKDIEREGVAIIKNLITELAKGTGKDERIVLVHFIKRLSDQFEGVNYGVIGYKGKYESSIS